MLGRPISGRQARCRRQASGRAAARRRPEAAARHAPNVVGKGPLLSAPGPAPRHRRHRPRRGALPARSGWPTTTPSACEHVFLYDNGSNDALDEVIEPWVNHGLVTLVHWPLPGGQIDAYAHALRFYGPSVEWLAFIDVDEFIVPLVDDDIPTLLARWPDAADVRVPRVDFGFSGHRAPPRA